jgi:signal transduction histidine kinase/HAMP domain-containing protein
MRFGVSMRWWLGLTFAAIAALTALSVAQVFSRRAESAIRDRGVELAIGQTVSAASATSQALKRGDLSQAATLIADRRRFSLWVFANGGSPLTSTDSRHVAFEDVPNGKTARRSALAGRRYVATTENGRAIIVGLRLPGFGGGIVTYTKTPELQAAIGVVQDEIVTAALAAVVLGAVVGLLVAALIATRLRGIARAAARIEAGGFDQPLQVHFNDELGALAETIEQMRVRLRESFGRLEDERDRLRQLLEGLQEAVVAVDRDLRVAFANRAARPMLGGVPVPEGEPLPEPWPDFALRAFAERLFDGGDAVRQARVIAGDGTFALIGIPARAGATDAILVVSDISERERRERAEREFVANAAHELGTPLTAITASLEVLRSGAKEVPRERDRFLELIERQTRRLSRLRRALLMLARAQTRQEALRLEPVAVRPLLETVAAELAATAGDVELAVHARDDLAVLADPDLLEQIVVNLVDNALRHAGPHRVELVAQPQPLGLATIEVRDDGRGIPAAERERLFDRFYRAESDGSGFGLGLAIVREAVRALGGRVEVRPGAGGGTAMRISLARAPLEAPLPEHPL